MFKSHRITFAVVAALLSSASIAQRPLLIPLGERDGQVSYLSIGQDLRRIGTGVIFTIVSTRNDRTFGYINAAVAGCNGEWITSSVNSYLKAGPEVEPQQLLSDFTRRQTDISLTAVDFQDAASSQLFYAQQVSKRAQALCKQAAAEPRNIFITVGNAPDSSKTGTSWAIVSGTARVKGDEIDVWLRGTSYTEEPIFLTDGKIWEIDGEVQKSKTAAERYTMSRRAFNCRDRTAASYESIEYADRVSAPRAWSEPREKLVLTSVVPGSVGEGQLEAVCRLYSPATRNRN